MLLYFPFRRSRLRFPRELMRVLHNQTRLNKYSDSVPFSEVGVFFINFNFNFSSSSSSSFILRFSILLS